jgi:modulator of FtsH protease
MQPDMQTVNPAQGGVAVAAPNKVLRNTYMLLALSMVPTVIGALIGIQLNLKFLSGWIGLLVFLGGAFAFMFAIEKTKDSALGVVILLGFTFFMGLMLSRLLGMMLGFKNGGQLIALAFGGTAGIFAVMATLGTVIKRDISWMGKFLFVGALVVFFAAIANVFFQLPALTLAIAAVAMIVFSAYILYDVNQIVTGGETNYIIATLNIYLDVYNVFQSLLIMLGVLGGDD